MPRGSPMNHWTRRAAHRARGTLFGLKTAGDSKACFVDDGSNTLNLLHSFPSWAGQRAQPTCRIIHAVAGLVACRRSISAVTSFAG